MLNFACPFLLPDHSERGDFNGEVQTPPVDNVLIIGADQTWGQDSSKPPWGKKVDANMPVWGKAAPAGGQSYDPLHYATSSPSLAAARQAGQLEVQTIKSWHAAQQLQAQHTQPSNQADLGSKRGDSQRWLTQSSLTHSPSAPTKPKANQKEPDPTLVALSRAGFDYVGLHGWNMHFTRGPNERVTISNGVAIWQTYNPATRTWTNR